MRALAASMLAVAGLLVTPAAASADTTLPNPDSLRAILPDAVDTSWIEVVPGTSGYIDGPVDYNVIRSYYTYYQQSDSFIQRAIDTLRNGGFVGGYERQWVQRQSQEVLTEGVDVFATRSGALMVAKAFNSPDPGASSENSFDTTLGADATGATETLQGAVFTTVGFVRGNASYNVGIASYKSVSPDQVIVQARVLYDRAPASIALPLPPPSALSCFLAPVIVTLLLGAALLATAVVIAAVATSRPRLASAAVGRP